MSTYRRVITARQIMTNPLTNTLYKERDLVIRPILGATLQKVADDPFTFYNGTLAADIIKDLEETGGIITADDLKEYTAEVKDAICMNFSSGYTVMSPPQPSCGGIVLLILNILEGFNFNEESIATVSETVETYHKIIEAFKHGFSARTKFGDADVESQELKDQLQELLTNITSSAYGAEKRRLITDQTHTTSYYQPLNSGEASDAGTSHISLLAPNGDAVSITSSINSRQNVSIHYADVILVVGSAGGAKIITSIALIILETLIFNLGLKESIDVPRFHHQLFPDEIRITERFQQTLREGLEERGHKFNVIVPKSVVHAVLQRKPDEIYANCDHCKYGLPDGV